jgi:hypothetical protein
MHISRRATPAVASLTSSRKRRLGFSPPLAARLVGEIYSAGKEHLLRFERETNRFK